MDGKSPWLKIHMPDGGLYRLNQWTIDEERNTISGRGSRLDSRRVEVVTGMFTVGMDSVSILESNEIQTSGAAAGLTVRTTIAVESVSTV